MLIRDLSDFILQRYFYAQVLNWSDQIVIFEEESHQLEDGQDEEEEDALEIELHTPLVLLSLCEVPVNF